MRKWGFAALLAAPVLALAACDDGSESAVFATPPNPPAPPPPPPPPPAPSTFSITGQLSGNEALATDSDVNDQFSAVVRNNSFSTAQTEQTPAIIKGFVTLPGTGVPQDNFPNAANNDVSDFFAVTASAGQIVNLQIADFEPASPLDVDLDLALYDASQNLIASSNSLGASESIQIAADGDYFIEVVAFRGTSIYTLTISTALASSSNGIAPHIGRVSPTFLSVEADPSDAGMQVLQAASVMSASSQPTKQLKRGDVVRLDPKALVASAQLQSDGQIDTSSEKRRLRAAQIEALRVAKAMNVAEGRDVYKPMEQPRTFQSDPNPDPFLQWNLPSIGWPEAQTLIADAEAASGPFTYDPIVAVIDSGFQTAHPDIAPVLGDQREFVPASVDGDGFQAEAEEDVNPADPGFCHSFHGSHVGSTATAPQNSVGIV
ncbi:MAG: pre-peptidase C-terminal domain-containing protein, partial [Pseudomonadota bacterium]